MKKLLIVILLLSWACSANAKIEVWVHPWLKPISIEEAPPSMPETSIKIRTTPGEYEPACFAVCSEKKATASVSLADCTSGPVLPGAWCEIHRVEPMADNTQPKRLYEFSLPVELKPDQTQFFWVTVRPPEDTPPGIYNGKIEISSESAMESIDFSVEVLPFRLQESPITGGVFMCLVDLPPGWYRDMKKHGLDAIQFFTWEWGIRGRETLGQSAEWELDAIKIKRHGERMMLDFTVMDEIMADLNQAGMKGPVIISLGNDHHLFYECRIAQTFGIPIDTTEVTDGKRIIAPAISPRLDELYVEGLRQIRDHWRSKKYPQELVVLIYDEPTERLLERCKNRYDLLKTVMPDTRVYGVVMNRREWVLSMIDQCDIIVTNGDFIKNEEIARTYGKGYWVYGGPLGAVHRTRYDMGCLPWRMDADGAFFWMYNYWFYNPDGCVVYRDPVNPARLVSSTRWEAVREATDDLRYFATAEHFLKSAPTGIKEKAMERLQMVKQSIPTRHRARRPRGVPSDEAALLKYFNEPQRIRDEVIGIILDLL